MEWTGYVRQAGHEPKSITLSSVTNGADQQLTAGRFRTWMWIPTTHSSGAASPYVFLGRVRALPGSLKHWVSGRTVALLKSRKNIPAGPEHNLIRLIIRHQLKVSVRADREVWWTQKAKEMKEAQKAGNARGLFQLIRASSPRKPPVSKLIKNRNALIILNKERIDRWAEKHSSWPPAANHLDPVDDVESWTVDVEPPTTLEVYDCLCSLKCHRASCSDDLPLVLFKDGGEVLSYGLFDLLDCLEKRDCPRQLGRVGDGAHFTKRGS
ncbi:ATP-binding cassette transporter [Clonorchis sinensis]|uniref:ATP-binding cassette transporter n=1 Tax=Clonorchis sinensis TaxID=79923 RepID=G7YK56_CLOSI|nr:ATP-binding cassette transporter [Clonorchis sinensis]